MDKISALTIFTAIRELVSNSKIFKTDEENDEFIINTYLTACNARNAYIPEFRVEEYNRQHDPEKVRDLMDSINKIPELKVVYGPYYDTGENYVICNKENFSATKKILSKLDKYSDEPVRSSFGEVHILIGKLLSYTCPMFLTNYDNMFWSIQYKINNIKFLGFLCPIDVNVGKKEFELLNKISSAIDLLDMDLKVEMSVTQVFP